MKGSGQYILVGQTPVPCDDLIEWATWFGDNEHRQVRLTKVGRWHVSTIFLGLDHRWSLKGPPLLFETMTWKRVKPYKDSFGIEHNRKFSDVQQRCATWPEAEKQHERIVAMIAQPGVRVKQLYPEPLPEIDDKKERKAG